MVCISVLQTYSRAQVAVTPAKATLLVGDSQRFRAVNAQGHSLTNVHWTISRSGTAEVSSGSEVEVVPRQVGNFTLTAHASEGSADAQVQVLSGTTLPMGTVKWSGGDFPGCHTSKIMPAVPSATGVADVFEDSVCADGHYLSAFTAEGILAWRRKVTSSNGANASAEDLSSAIAAESLNTHRASICDSISVYMKKEAVGELLHTGGLRVPADVQNTWVIDEDGTQCKLWFDDQEQVTKKRKTLVTD